MTFPGSGASIDYNDAGEVIGWDYPNYDEPYNDPYDGYDWSDYGDEDDEPTYDVESLNGEWIIVERDDQNGRFLSHREAEEALSNVLTIRSA